MIFFEVFKQLDARMYRTAKAFVPVLNPTTRYIIEQDSIVVLGTNISVKWDLSNKSITEENPLKHWDLEGESLYWFSEESAQSAVVRMMSNIIRQWFGVDPFPTFSEFEKSEAEINALIARYGLKIVCDMDRVAVIKNDERISFETAIAMIVEDDALAEAGMSVDEWLYDARYFRQTDQLERAIEQYERVLRYSNITMRVYTESAFCLAESFYFLGDYEKAVDMYFKCNLEFIEDEADFYIHIGHALLDVKMPNFEQDIHVYYRGCLDQAFAMNHMREIERAAEELAENFELYESKCLMIGQKKYNDHIRSLPMKSEVVDEIVSKEEDEKNRIEIAKNRYYDVRLLKPTVLMNLSTISINEAMLQAFELLNNGEYQKAYEMYYKLSESVDVDSDYATWINFQLGKLYYFCNDPLKTFEVLRKCKIGKFGVVYRQTDFFVLYAHVKIICDDFESDERFRKLIRGKFDSYYAKYDQEYLKLVNNAKMMNRFRRYENECLNSAREEFGLTSDIADLKTRKNSRNMGENGLLRGISKYFSE